MHRFLTAVAALALLVAACGTSADTSTTTTTRAADTTTTTTGATTTTTSQTTTTSGDTTTTTTTTRGGDPIDLFAQPGDVLSVVGVAHDDVLNVRSGPGTSNDIIATIEPLGFAVASGEARDIGQSFWYEVTTAEGVTGWVSFIYTAFAGQTDDATDEVVAALGEVPTADTMEELGMIVAGTQASTGEVESSIEMSAAPSGFGLMTVTYDVVGLLDDSIYGFRLRVTGQAVSDGFSLNSVERTALCARGIDPTGLCL